MNRFRQAVMSDEELQAITNRFVAAARLLKVDEVKIEHKVVADSKFSVTPESTLSLRLGMRWLTARLDWMAIEDARDNKFDRISEIAIVVARRLHAGEGDVITSGASRFDAVASELDIGKEDR